MRAILIGSAIFAAIFLAACGSSREDPRAWKHRFTLQVREDIEATKRVGEAIRSADSPFDVQRTYEIYAAEMVVAEERLEALDSAPNGCGDAVRLVLRVVRDGSFAGATFNQKNYTPTLLRNAKSRPAETIEKLERDLSFARC